MQSQKGFSFIFVIIIMVVLLLVAGLIYYFIAIKPIFTSSPQTQYKNPFENSTEYQNPFTEYQNPFDNLK